MKGPHFNVVDPNRAHGGIRLSLIGGFELIIDGHAAVVPPAASRVLVFLALQERPIARSLVAGTLWPETTDARAGASLRSTLWRISQLDSRLLHSENQRLSLGAAVAVDLEQANVKCRWLLDLASPLPERVLTMDLIDDELLPEWDEDWLRKAQVTFRQRRLWALDALATRLNEAGRHWEAIEVGLEAVAAEPLRESAHRTLVVAHLADGNWSEAIRQHQAYRDLLNDELGVEPTSSFMELLRPSSARADLIGAGHKPS